ncbi:hypothetical protein GCM10010191_46030 [Actinomadura vinacea]|uniref:Uncharacterized protein n=1 Tax=Actinomadura vinacea TaxID=115336 RepID=A0ABP5WLH8_9ACTN
MTTPATNSTPARRKASFGLAATLLAVPAAVAFLDPGLAAILFTAELAVVLLILTAAVFSPRTTSERAFRLLRWMTGNPEPAHQDTSPSPPA